MTSETPTPDRNLLGRWTPAIVLVVLGAIIGGVITLSRETGRDRRPAKLDDAFVYDVERYKVIPPERIGYREVARIETGLTQATALAVGPEDQIVVGGDEQVLVFSPDGTPGAVIPTGDTPYALTTSPAGVLFVATKNRVGQCEFKGPILLLCTIPGEKPRITSIAVDQESIFVADAGSRGVWRYTLAGGLCGRLGDKNADRHIPGFAVPSPFFDLLVAPDGLLRIVDPGRHRIRAFTTDGHLELSWGRSTFALEGFSGCCNPSHIALLPDGSFVTSEKGIPRVKVYDAEGNFVTAVVGSDGLDTEYYPCDVATDSKGRILVLDPAKQVVRIFESLERVDRDD